MTLNFSSDVRTVVVGTIFDGQMVQALAGAWSSGQISYRP